MGSLFRDVGDGGAEGFWGGWNSVPTATGIEINQRSAMQVATVMACVRIISEDISKMTPRLYRMAADGSRQEVVSGALADRLWQPNDWGYVARILPDDGDRVRAARERLLRDHPRRARQPGTLVPINPDHVTLWEAPDGSLIDLVTLIGTDEMAVLSGLPMLIPADYIFHLKDLSANGLIGQSPISLAREAIALSAAQEQQLARLMGNGARPSGVLTTDKTLTPDVAKRLKDNWNDTMDILNREKPSSWRPGCRGSR